MEPSAFTALWSRAIRAGSSPSPSSPNAISHGSLLEAAGAELLLAERRLSAMCLASWWVNLRPKFLRGLGLSALAMSNRSGMLGPLGWGRPGLCGCRCCPLFPPRDGPLSSYIRFERRARGMITGATSMACGAGMSGAGTAGPWLSGDFGLVLRRPSAEYGAVSLPLGAVPRMPLRQVVEGAGRCWMTRPPPPHPGWQDVAVFDQATTRWIAYA